MGHGNGLDFFAVHLERAGAGTTETAHVIKGKRADAKPVILEVKLECVFAGRERVRTFPLNTVQVNQVPEKHRPALEQVEAIAGEAPAGGQDHAFRAAFGHFNIRCNGVGAVEQERGIALRQTDHRMGENELRATGCDIRARGHDTGSHRGVHRKDLIFLGFRDEHLLHLLHFAGKLIGDVLGLAEVRVQIVKLKHLIVERVGIGSAEGFPRCPIHLGTEQPAFLVQGPLAKHLEILGLVVRRFLGIFRIKRVGKTRTLDRCLLDAVYRFGCRNAGGLENCRYDVNHMAELLAQAALILDACRPRNGHVLANTSEFRGVLLEPGKRCIKGPRPARRHVVVSLLGAPDVIPFHLIGYRHLVDAVEPRDFVRRAHRATFGAGTVVAVDIDDERVVELAHVLNSLNDASDFAVVVSGKRGENFHLLDEELLLLGCQIIPVFEDIRWPRLQPGILRDHAELLLVFKNLLAKLVPAHVKDVHVVDLLYPFLGRMMWSVCSSRRVFQEKRFVGYRLVNAIQVIDGIVGHSGDQIPFRLTLEWINLCGVAEKIRLPLVRITTDEAIEILEAHAGRPLIERTNLAGSEGRRVVILAKP